MSIKRKIATAIATAGLLAGLFGSAFVPSAMAARTIDTDASYAFVNHSGSAVDGELGLDGTHSSYDGSGGYGDADLALPKRLQISSYVDYGVFPGDNSLIGRQGPDNFLNSEDFSIGFYLQDDEGDPIEATDLTATVTGGKVKVAFSYLENDFSRSRCSTPALRSEFKSTGDSVMGAVSDGTGMEGIAGNYYLCIRAVSKTTLGTSNVTIKADGVTIWSGSVQVIGDLDSTVLSVRNGYNHVASGNALDSLFFHVVMKDAAGQAICGTHDGFHNDCEDDDFLAQGDDELHYYARGASSEDFFGDFETGEDSEASLAANACAADGSDAGETFTAAAAKDNYEGDKIISNTISIVCTEAQTEYVVAATGITQEYSNPILSGEATWIESAQGVADATGAIEISAVVKDSTGALMGVDDSTGFDGAMAFTFDGNGDLNLDDFSVASTVSAGGKVVLGDYVPTVDAAAKYLITVDFVDGNGAVAEDQAVSKKLYYLVSMIDSDYTLTRVRNAAKTVATWTADYGLDCSNALVSFDWISGNGLKYGTVDRRANFDGVAKFKLARRNMTIYVTAIACTGSGLPDLGPVKARFR